MKLYPHQQRAIDELRRSLHRGHRTPVVQAPTGMGKTVLAGHITENALQKGNRVIFAVPRVSLITQTVGSFARHGITQIGVLQADHPLTDPHQPVQIASIQTLQRRRFVPPCELVILDEVHERFKFVNRWMESWNKIPFIGLSATPWAKGMGKYHDDLIIAATTADLIRDGYLSDFRVYAPSAPDLKGVRVQGGDYVERELGARMRPLTADIVSTWLELGESRPTLCFAVDRAHAKQLQQEFWQAGVPTGYVDCFTPLEERDQVGAALRRGDIKVVCNVNCLSVGVDWDVRCLILARPTKSPIRHVQTIGRGLRTAPGKSDCLILDHSDSHKRLGFVTDIHADKLDDGTERGHYQHVKTREAKECPKCHYMRPPGKAICPACGYQPQHRREVATNPGRLQEIKTSEWSADTKAHFLAELRYIQRMRGYAPGWIKATYRKITGEWPALTGGVKSPSPETWHIVDRMIDQWRSRAEKQR